MYTTYEIDYIGLCGIICFNPHEFQAYFISSETRRGFHVLQPCTLLGIEVTVAKGALSGLVTTSGEPDARDRREEVGA